jgi:hypothetical protein
MDFKPQLTRIQSKLNELFLRDKDKALFGASQHQYKLNPPKKEAELAWFEQQNGIQLPPDYRAFLLQVGNGGVGPYYGLQRLESGRIDDLDDPKTDQLLDLSKPFLFTEAWNMNLPEDPVQRAAMKEEEYHNSKWANGLLRIANYGCATFINLVVNGAEYGKIWVDDRQNDGGIHPDHLRKNSQRLNFLDWYELWLDQSLEHPSLASIESLGGRAPFS